MNLFASRTVHTVSEVTAKVKATLESEFDDLLVEGEIANFTAAGSGHLYFTLKDQGAQLKCVCFRSRARFLKFKPEDGLRVVVAGNLSVYELRGEYQLYAEYMEPQGLGSLQLAFEQLKAKLHAEGLFAMDRKRPLPLLPRCIGVVTSTDGAALHDILRVLKRRHENVRVLICNAKVQGDGAGQEIAAAIRALNQCSDVDVMIVGRGGGSIADLWAFNEESVARAIFHSRVPVISAVGHEVDFTIADFVADLRAPTPSAAAELVVSRKSDIIERLENLERRLNHVLQFRFSQARGRILELSADRVFLSVENRLAAFHQRVDELGFRMDGCVEHRIDEAKGCCKLLGSQLSRFEPLQTIGLKWHRLAGAVDRLDAQLRHLLQSSRGRLDVLNGALCALSPLAVLERGYAICKDSEGRILKHTALLQVGDRFSVQLYSGGIGGRVEELEPPSRANEPGTK